MALEKKKFKFTRNAILLLLGEMGTIFVTMSVTNYMTYFFVPTVKSSIPVLIPQAALWFAIIRGVGILSQRTT